MKSVFLNLKNNIKHVSNWFDIYFFQLGLKNSLKIKYRNNYEIYLNKINKPYAIAGHYYLIKLLNAGCMFNDNLARINENIKMVFPLTDFSIYCQLYETFFEENYEPLNVENKVVGDIGAAFGDTAIYFASKGAKKIYAYEPLLESYKYLLKNININNLNTVIMPKNIAISNNKGRIYIKPKPYWWGKSITGIINNYKGYFVDTNKIDSDIDVLKIDCEGCEYELIKSNFIKNMEEIIIEFHEGSGKLLRELHKHNFKTRIFKEYLNKSHGILYAYK